MEGERGRDRAPGLERECRLRHFLHGIKEIKNIIEKSASWHDLFIISGQRKSKRNQK
jgi:hypothetical protein